MRYIIIEKLRKLIPEGALTRHNAGDPSNDKPFDPEARKNKEKNIKYNYEKVMGEIAKAKAEAIEYNINTLPNYPNNGSLYRIILTSHGRFGNKDLAKLNNNTQEKDPNNQKIGMFDTYGPSNDNMVMYVSAPKKYDHMRDLPEPAVRTQLMSPYQEAKIKALVYFEKNIIDHFNTLFGLDKYEDEDTPEYADSRMSITQKDRKDHMDARDTKSDNIDSNFKRIKTNFEKLIPHVQYAGNPNNKKVKVLKKRLIRELTAIRRYSFHWLSVVELKGSNIKNINNIMSAQKKILGILERLEVALKEDNYTLPILLKSLYKQLDSDEGLN